MEEKEQVLAENEPESSNLIAKLPVELHRELKHWCIDHNTTIRDVVIDFVKTLLNRVDK